jgi:hypothetical protein
MILNGANIQDSLLEDISTIHGGQHNQVSSKDFKQNGKGVYKIHSPDAHKRSNNMSVKEGITENSFDSGHHHTHDNYSP